MKTKRPKRMVWRVKWLKSLKRWRIFDPRYHPEDNISYFHKEDAVYSARRSALSRWMFNCDLSQLVIYGKNGRIQREFTYGRDPKRYKS